MVELYSAALIASSIVVAGVLSIRLKISSSIFEVLIGLILGALFSVKIESWLDFLGTFGGLVLTFLAGAEVEMALLRNKAHASLTMGALAFLAPLLGELLFLSLVTDWSVQAKLAIALALTTTSVAVVYAVLTEYEILKLPISKVIIAVTFVNDILTIVGINFISPSFDIVAPIFVISLIVLIFVLPRLLKAIVEKYGRKAVEIELRFVLATLIGVSFFADISKLHAVFGAFVLGLIFANSIQKYQDMVGKMRTVTFALLSPAFFIRAGLLISLTAVAQNFALVLGILGVKLLSKFIGTYALCRKWIPEGPMFSTMLFSTGLTVGTITATLGRDLGFLNQTQFSIAVTGVVLSAVIPTLIAKRFVPRKA